MIIYLERRRFSLPFRTLSFFISFSFILTLLIPSPAFAQAIGAGVFNLPQPGMMLSPSTGYVPPMLKGLVIHPENPLQFDFIVNTGDENLSADEVRLQSDKLVKYFLSALTVPEDEVWVNLSPYEGDRMIPQTLGQTDMGRDLLAQDYLLKQLTASLMYPEDELGQKFWKRVYQKAMQQFGTTDIPLNTFNKVWIVPSEAVVYQNGATVYVVQSRLKVMLEEDYLAYSAERIANREEGLNANRYPLSAEIIKEIIVPELEKEVNEGETFANLRQMYNSMILATWYKLNLKESLLGRVYVNQNKTKGIDQEDKDANRKIYDQYLEAFRVGVYDYIKEDYDPASQEMVPRKYFSGGYGSNAVLLQSLQTIKGSPADLSAEQRHTVEAGLSALKGKDYLNAVNLLEIGAGADENELAKARTGIAQIPDQRNTGADLSPEGMGVKYFSDVWQNLSLGDFGQRVTSLLKTIDLSKNISPQEQEAFDRLMAAIDFDDPEFQALVTLTDDQKAKLAQKGSLIAPLKFFGENKEVGLLLVAYARGGVTPAHKHDGRLYRYENFRAIEGEVIVDTLVETAGTTEVAEGDTLVRFVRLKNIESVVLHRNAVYSEPKSATDIHQPKNYGPNPSKLLLLFVQDPKANGLEKSARQKALATTNYFPLTSDEIAAAGLTQTSDSQNWLRRVVPAGISSGTSDLSPEARYPYKFGVEEAKRLLSIYHALQWGDPVNEFVDQDTRGAYFRIDMPSGKVELVTEATYNAHPNKFKFGRKVAGWGELSSRTSADLSSESENLKNDIGLLSSNDLEKRLVSAVLIDNNDDIRSLIGGIWEIFHSTAWLSSMVGDFYRIGLAVEPEQYEAIKKAFGAEEMPQSVGLAGGTRVFELDSDDPVFHFDVMTYRKPDGEIYKFLQNAGRREGVQKYLHHVKLYTTNLEQALGMLKQKADTGDQRIRVLTDQPVRGASREDMVAMIFFTLDDGQKVMLELVQNDNALDLPYGADLSSERNSVDALEDAYKRGETDEFVEPTVRTDGLGNPVGRIQKGDYVSMVNFRPDRFRQITGVLMGNRINGGDFDNQDLALDVTTMTEYQKGLVPEDHVVMPPIIYDQSSGEVISDNGLTQVRIAETEKYAHVTYFINGGSQEEPLKNEDRVLIDSPKVEKYDQTPEMKTVEVTDAIIEAIGHGYNSIKANYAAGDMVGHTGDFEAAVKAVEIIDANLGRLVPYAVENGYTVVITADHGNVEKMRDENGKPHTAHSTNLVPFIVIPSKDVKGEGKIKSGGTLIDVAPTVLEILGLEKSGKMTGQSLVEGFDFSGAQKKVIEIILDGWGINEDRNDPSDATRIANTPNMDKFLASKTDGKIEAHGGAVGLPEGIMGNSEVGHMAIGLGRVPYQSLSRINMAIEDGSFFEKGALVDAMKRAKTEQDKRGDSTPGFHLFALVSDGGVHSDMGHIYAELELAKRIGLENVYVHAILDGRDTPQKSADKYLAELEAKAEEIGVGAVVDVVGRFYAMDRDKRWERTKKAFDLYVKGKAGHSWSSDLSSEIVLAERPQSNRTKIVATVGPASDSDEMIEELILAGVDVFRLNYSHINTPEEQVYALDLQKRIRTIADRLKRPTGILQDLAGPKIRTSKLDHAITVKINDTLSFYPEGAVKPAVDGAIIPIEYGGDILAEVRPGETIALNDGNVKMTITLVDKDKGYFQARAFIGGVLEAKRNGVNLPTSNLSVRSLSEKDKQDFLQGFESEVDFVALSFVRKGMDVQELIDLIMEYKMHYVEELKAALHGSGIEDLDQKFRDRISQKIVREDIDEIYEKIEQLNVSDTAKEDLRVKFRRVGTYIPIIPKIETPQAVENIDEILKLADGIMVARGDYVAETDISKLAQMQKKVIRKAREAGKPVIIATQVLSGMEDGRVPSRSDAIAIHDQVAYDQVDAQMLSGETAKTAEGDPDKPLRAVQFLEEITREAEITESEEKKAIDSEQLFDPESRQDVVSATAVTMSNKMADARALVVFTGTGNAARLVAQKRPFKPVIAVTRRARVARMLNIVRNVHPVTVKYMPQDRGDFHDFAVDITRYVMKDQIEEAIRDGRKFRIVMHHGDPERSSSAHTVTTLDIIKEINGVNGARQSREFGKKPKPSDLSSESDSGRTAGQQLRVTVEMETFELLKERVKRQINLLPQKERKLKLQEEWRQALRTIADNPAFYKVADHRVYIQEDVLYAFAFLTLLYQSRHDNNIGIYLKSLTEGSEQVITIFTDSIFETFLQKSLIQGWVERTLRPYIGVDGLTAERTRLMAYVLSDQAVAGEGYLFLDHHELREGEEFVRQYLSLRNKTSPIPLQVRQQFWWEWKEFYQGVFTDIKADVLYERSGIGVDQIEAMIKRAEERLRVVSHALRGEIKDPLSTGALRDEARRRMRSQLSRRDFKKVSLDDVEAAVELLKRLGDFEIVFDAKEEGKPVTFRNGLEGKHSGIIVRPKPADLSGETKALETSGEKAVAIITAGKKVVLKREGGADWEQLEILLDRKEGDKRFYTVRGENLAVSQDGASRRLRGEKTVQLMAGADRKFTFHAKDQNVVFQDEWDGGDRIIIRHLGGDRIQIDNSHSTKKLIVSAPGTDLSSESPLERLDVDEKAYPRAAVLDGAVVALQGVGNIGSLLLGPLLNAGAKVIASDTNFQAVIDISRKYQKFVYSGQLFVILEERTEDGFTQHIMNPIAAFPGAMYLRGIDKVDIFIPAAQGEVVNPQTIPMLKEAGVRLIVGSANNMLQDKKRDSRLLQEAGIATVPDYRSNFGGVWGVSAHLKGADISPQAVREAAQQGTRDLLTEAREKSQTPQEIADEQARRFFESLEQAQKVSEEESFRLLQLEAGTDVESSVDEMIEDNRDNPKRLDGLTLEDGSTVRVYAYKNDLLTLPPEVAQRWDNHYAVFEIKNEKLGYTVYMGIHRLTKIHSKVKSLDGQYRATGGTRMLQYKSDAEAVIDSLELSYEMSYKNAGAKATRKEDGRIVGLEIGGSKNTIRVGFDPDPRTITPENAAKKEAILISYAKAIEQIGHLIGGGVFTGQDLNMSPRNIETLQQYASTSISPNPGQVYTIAPAEPTSVSVYNSLAAAAEFIRLNNDASEPAADLSPEGGSLTDEEVKRTIYGLRYHPFLPGQDYDDLRPIPPEIIETARKVLSSGNDIEFVLRDSYNPFDDPDNMDNDDNDGRDWSIHVRDVFGHLYELVARVRVPYETEIPEDVQKMMEMSRNFSVRKVEGLAHPSDNSGTSSYTHEDVLEDPGLDNVLQSVDLMAAKLRELSADKKNEGLMKVLIQRLQELSDLTVMTGKYDWFVDLDRGNYYDDLAPWDNSDRRTNAAVKVNIKARDVLNSEPAVGFLNRGADLSAESPDTFTKGGIDLNPELLDLQIKRGPDGVPLPLPQQPIQNMKIDGFLPVIINVTPVPSVPMLLGFADTPDSQPAISASGLMPAEARARFEIESQPVGVKQVSMLN